MREFWHGLGSRERYTPKWPWTRRAYVEGLRDAQRIVEIQAWAHAKNGLGPEQNCREAIKAIHARETTISSAYREVE